MYCIGCESFKKDDDLVFLNKTSGQTFPITPKVVASDNIIKVCPDHLTTPDSIKEKNYFFKLSRYQAWMSEFYEANPGFVIPSNRFNEVISFVKGGLEDFSISRESNTF
jgi:methionyl-tRNA synthetase